MLSCRPSGVRGLSGLIPAVSPAKTDEPIEVPFAGADSREFRKPYKMGCTLAPPVEYDGWSCAAAAATMLPVATISVANCHLACALSPAVHVEVLQPNCCD